MERKPTQAEKEPAQARKSDVPEIQTPCSLVRTDAPYHSGKKRWMVNLLQKEERCIWEKVDGEFIAEVGKVYMCFMGLLGKQENPP